MNSLISGAENGGILDGLPSLIGKSIIVFTNSGGISGNGFSGILIEVGTDFIRIITNMPSKCRRCSKNIYCKPGSSTVILKNHIIAITYNTL